MSSLFDDLSLPDAFRRLDGVRTQPDAAPETDAAADSEAPVANTPGDDAPVDDVPPEDRDARPEEDGPPPGEANPFEAEPSAAPSRPWCGRSSAMVPAARWDGALDSWRAGLLETIYSVDPRPVPSLRAERSNPGMRLGRERPAALGCFAPLAKTVRV